MKLSQRAVEGSMGNGCLPQSQVWSGAESSCYLVPQITSLLLKLPTDLLLKLPTDLPLKLPTDFPVWLRGGVVRDNRKRKMGVFTSASLLSTRVLWARRVRFPISVPALDHPATINSQALGLNHSIRWERCHLHTLRGIL